MTPAPSAGGEGTRKKRRRRRPPRKKGNTDTAVGAAAAQNKNMPRKPKQSYVKRVDEVSAGGLVIDSTGK